MKQLPKYALPTILACTTLTCLGQTNDGRLLDLYHGFVRDANCHAFVCFERERVIPKPASESRVFKIDGTHTGKILPQSPVDYFELCQNDTTFLVAYSAKGPVTNLYGSNIIEQLYGFDGGQYWSLSLNLPVRTPTGSFNRLTVIPSREAAQTQKHFRSDIHFITVQETDKECLRVMQMGCPKPLRSAPRFLDDRLDLGSSTGINDVSYVGSPDDPTEIDYIDAYNNRTSAFLDYGANLLTIRKSHSGTVFSEFRYRILETGKQPESQSKELCSWQTYRKTAGNLIGTLITNGATIKLEIDQSGTIKPTYTLVRPEPVKTMPFERKSRMLTIYILFIVATAGAVLAGWKMKPIQSNKTNTL